MHLLGGGVQRTHREAKKREDSIQAIFLRPPSPRGAGSQSFLGNGKRSRDWSQQDV